MMGGWCLRPHPGRKPDGGSGCRCCRAAQPRAGGGGLGSLVEQGPGVQGSLGGGGGDTGAGGCPGQGALGPAQALLAAGCARPPVGSVSLHGSCWSGEGLRGEVAPRAQGRGALVLGKRHLEDEALSLSGPGSWSPFSPRAELGREQALLPERESAGLSPFLPRGCGRECTRAVGETWREGGCLPRAAGLARLGLHRAFGLFWPGICFARCVCESLASSCSV